MSVSTDPEPDVDVEENRPPEEAADPGPELSTLVAAEDAEGCTRWLEGTQAAETVRVLSRLTSDDRELLLELLEPADAADALESMPEPQAIEAMEGIEPATAARILEELPSDEAADFIGDLDAEDAEKILHELNAEEADSVRRLAAYEDDVAGGLMATEFLMYSPTDSLGHVFTDLSAQAEEDVDIDIQHTYVVDDDGRLLGVLPLRDMLLAPRGRVVSKLMIPVTLTIADDATVPDIAAVFRDASIISVPVVDRELRLVGVLDREAVEHQLHDEADEAYRASQGIVGGEELRTMPVVFRAKRRLAWLSTNVVLNVLAASIIAAHQDILQEVIALAVFLPIISDMSGCSGNQAVAVSMREMALGVARPADAFSVLLKELAVGVINGIALGLLIFLVATLWKGNAYLGLVVGGALALNTLVAVAIGGTVPLLLKRFGMDPALASGPVLTTLTDMCGFLLVLGSASVLIDKLV